MKELLSPIKKTGGPTPDSPTWLTGKFLVATPGMPDPRFARSLIYVCSHGPQGAMGLIVNRLLGEADFPLLLEQLHIQVDRDLAPDIPVQFGGPVEMGRGFVLHSNDYLRDGTVRIDDSISVTATIEIIEDIAKGKGPKRALLLLGYAGWSAGQLEGELKDNGWLTADVDETILFDPNLETKWECALKQIGIAPAMLSHTQGNA
ncbi:MAG: YqgE/AlgH family protein [Alphaproteobacteria bacterium]|nr:YqgE/AlgH family protein [Alphaproteobacteria bacterium]